MINTYILNKLDAILASEIDNSEYYNGVSIDEVIEIYKYDPEMAGQIFGSILIKNVLNNNVRIHTEKNIFLLGKNILDIVMLIIDKLDLNTIERTKYGEPFSISIHFKDTNNMLIIHYGYNSRYDRYTRQHTDRYVGIVHIGIYEKKVRKYGPSWDTINSLDNGITDNDLNINIPKVKRFMEQTMEKMN
jgi:hypothetical protein